MSIVEMNDVQAGAAVRQNLGSIVVNPWHIDVFGHMNARWHAHVFDDATVQFWHSLGLPPNVMIRDYGAHTVTAKVETEFVTELNSGDCAHVTGSITRIGSKSVTLAMELVGVATGITHARFQAVEVFVDAQNHQSTAIPHIVRAALEKCYVPDVPEG